VRLAEENAMTPINSLQTQPLTLPKLPTSAKVEAGSSFKNVFLESIEQVNSMQKSADQAVNSLLTGGDVNPAEVLTALQKADLTFRTMMQVRNKLLSAYQEIKDIRI
jgi:flagellar hook-basal body complex protein FliE